MSVQSETVNAHSWMDDMISGLYSAATALDAAETRHRIASENLAHIHQPGYRRRIIEQTTFTNALRQADVQTGYGQRLGTSVADTNFYVDHSPGTLEQTGRSLDAAIRGDGFFAVDGPEGPLYTRNGRFHADNDGTLVTVDGLPVRGLAGNITIPAEGGVNGLHIDQTGRVTVNGADVGQLELVRVSKDRQQELLAAGDSLFSSPDPASVEVFDGEVLQGYVENSNVSPIDELINIMVSSRQYEAARKAMTAIDESTRARIDLN